MKPLHESIQVTLSIPKHADQVFKNLGFDVNYIYQRDFLDTLRARLDTIKKEKLQ